MNSTMKSKSTAIRLRSRILPRQRHLKLFSALFLTAACFCLQTRAEDVPAVKPIEALMVTGGGWHDYFHQKDILMQGISAHANVHWTIFYETLSDEAQEMTLYSGKPDFWKGYDVILYNFCYSKVGDPDFVAKILAPHRAGIPAVLLHAAMGSFRALKGDAWYEFFGVDIGGHANGQPVLAKLLHPENPILIGINPEWITPTNDEMVPCNRVWPDVQPLVEAYTIIDKSHSPMVVWTHLYQGKTRVFCSTMGHEFVPTDANYTHLIANGLLWACDKLDTNGQPKPGYGPQVSPVPPTILPSQTDYNTGKLLGPPPAPQPSVGPQAPVATTARPVAVPRAIPGMPLAQAQLMAEIEQLGGIVSTEGDAPKDTKAIIDRNAWYKKKADDVPSGEIVGISFRATHAKSTAPNGKVVPPYEITDDLLAQIAKLPKLVHLDLTQGADLKVSEQTYSDAGVKHLKGMTQLQFLSLAWNNAVTDAGVADLEGLTNLQYLSLGATGVTAAGMKHVEGMKQLQVLHLFYTKLPSGCIQELQAALPQCSIHTH